MCTPTIIHPIAPKQDNIKNNVTRNSLIDIVLTLVSILFLPLCFNEFTKFYPMKQLRTILLFITLL